MDPWTILKTWTHRQFQVALEWIEREWNEPSRTDHYLMQLAAEIRRSNVKNPQSVKMDHFKIKFERKAKALPVNQGMTTKMTKARWKAAVGLGKRGKKDGRD